MIDHNKNPIQLGTVSHGTVRPQDLIPCFLMELRIYGCKSYQMLSDKVNSYDLMSKDGLTVNDDHPFWTSSACDEILDALIDTLYGMSPPYAYFGAHEGDGSDYGFWPHYDAIFDAIHDGELLQVSDLSEIPDKFTGDICLINDHGNMTIGRALHGVFYSCWAIV